MIDNYELLMLVLIKPQILNWQGVFFQVDLGRRLLWRAPRLRVQVRLGGCTGYMYPAPKPWVLLQNLSSDRFNRIHHASPYEIGEFFSSFSSFFFHLSLSSGDFRVLMT
jgi:hypothetical protein